MVKQRLLVGLMAVVLGLMVTGAAFAVGPPAERPGTKGKAAVCKMLDTLIEHKQNAGNRLEKVAARIQARIDSGDLTDAQEARAAKHLTRVQALIVKLDKRVDRLQAAVQTHCA